ncbi:hypothetical protein HO173_004462 [Letharia columbiana]|uniref:Uncharacterized protein n=1 Tax=Letharia columbiana TaxID=112416 RepID=A0A8H6L6K0_9LECA|nr:uncharacterized protein HO173_004462 [Letharia columbiana]KAF6237572.1 hypothetical protein HO173_004462 [Letharia columbiana]
MSPDPTQSKQWNLFASAPPTVRNGHQHEVLIGNLLEGSSSYIAASEVFPRT